MTAQLNEGQSNLIQYVDETIFSIQHGHAMTFTGSVFLVVYALKLGASNVTIGLLAAIPLLTQLIQIPSIF